MLRLLVALIVVLAALVPGGRAVAQSKTERVLLNATLWINPPSDPGACFLLGAGQLSISAVVTDPAIEGRPTTFDFFGLMEDPGTHISMRIGEQRTTTSKQITGGRYCWGVHVDAPETAGMANAQRGSYVIYVDALITHVPD